MNVLRVLTALMGAMSLYINPIHSHAQMLQIPVGGNWTLSGMGQVFPAVTAPLWGGKGGDPVRLTGWYLTQPAVMANVEHEGGLLALRTTLNFEGLTQRDGELTYGGWGESFIDKRHPHTLLHEFMLSFNSWNIRGADFSLSAGKGFAPYGTDDPMARPGLKYPTNHHLSQILERWTVNAVLLKGGWSAEAGVFGGTEPASPYDLSNIKSFGDSWSVRLARRWGSGFGPMAEWEASISSALIAESHDGEDSATRLWNLAVRHSGMVGNGTFYGLAEASRSEPEEYEGHFSVLGEVRWERAGHQPYLRVEYATRPEYSRTGEAGTDGFFRYTHDSDPIGATRWLINTVAYAYQLTDAPWSIRPFVEFQHHRARSERGGIEPHTLLGTSAFSTVSVGMRIFFKGGPMRMGSYGVLDPITAMGRQMMR